ncbi:MAG: alpha/beta hydrolase, partial [Roseibacillus sp.]|nr:alpha/beta hydrolase [Roseibacillus sp.]
MKTHFAFFLLATVPLWGQQAVHPTIKDVSYGPHKAQAVDVYLPKSDKPTPVMIQIHGGGWRAGSKKHVPSFLKRAVAEGWLAVVSVEYRFTDVAVHPAQTNDCLRAVQFVRSRAKEWNVDPARIGATGGSAGGHLSMFVATHPDLADPDSADPVARQSSRVQCAVPFAGPSDWSLLSAIKHDHPAYSQLIGYEPGTPPDQMKDAKKRAVSPVSYVSADDPPMMIVHGDADVIVPFAHADTMFKSLKAVGAEAELVRIKGGRHNVSGAGRTEFV